MKTNAKDSKNETGAALLLKKGLSILTCFPRPARPLSQTEIAQRTNLPMSTAARLSRVLTETGFLERDAKTKLYELGPRCYYLGIMARESGDLRRIALPIMHELRDQFNETVVLYKRTGDTRVYYEQVKSTQRLNQSAPPGDEVPLNIGGSGRCFLAYMPESEVQSIIQNIEPCTSNTMTDSKEIMASIEAIKKKGYTISISERDEGTASVCAPILNYEGEAIAVIVITGPVVRFSPEVYEEMIQAIKNASKKISVAMQ